MILCNLGTYVTPRLEKNNIVIKTRRVGKSDLYKLNTKNTAIKQLVKLDWNLVNREKCEYIEKN
ncbi:hypothetical protein J4405_03975 [Candidatus Woesearchaeota archaeon]|nr:hypothetical protein [uncultured archaeon]AQS34794.1 hypothetical protein [uncultured archaeon]MBS3141276.1 hypothetical protein [Candidatus Woesearchaeota archaeon]